MENNIKSREINVKSLHGNLKNTNIQNVWSVDITNNINEKEQSKLEQLERHAKSMRDRNARWNQELYNLIQARLKIESNKAMRAFNKPTTNKRKSRNRRRMTRRRRN